MLNPSERNLEALLLALTPSRLCDTVMALAREGGRPEEGVTLQALMDNLCGDLDLGTGREGWAHELRLKRAIVSLVAGLPSLRYIEGDA